MKSCPEITEFDLSEEENQEVKKDVLKRQKTQDLFTLGQQKALQQALIFYDDNVKEDELELEETQIKESVQMSSWNRYNMINVNDVKFEDPENKALKNYKPINYDYIRENRKSKDLVNPKIKNFKKQKSNDDVKHQKQNTKQNETQSSNSLYRTKKNENDKKYFDFSKINAQIKSKSERSILTDISYSSYSQTANNQNMESQVLEKQEQQPRKETFDEQDEEDYLDQIRRNKKQQNQKQK